MHPIAHEPTDAHLAAIVELSDDAILSKALDGEILTWNAAAERMYGYSAEEAIGRSIGIVVPPDRQEELERILERVRGGEPVAPLQTVRMRKDGSRLDVLLSISPVRDGSGRLVGASSITRDITDLVRAERNERFLAEASRVLGSSLSYDRTLLRVAHLSIEYVADWCIVDLITPDGTIDRVGVAASDPHKQEILEEVKERYPPTWDSPQPAAQALRAGESVLFEEFTDERLAETVKDDEHLRLMRELSPVAAIAVPLVSRRRMLGAITFAVSESGRRYRPRDLALAEALAVRAALAIDNARLFEERSHIARTLQRGLLPPRLPEIPGVEVEVRYRVGSAGQEVGGDFYDVFERRRGRVFFFVGDVSGKDPEAAALSGVARHTVRASAAREERPSRLLALLNEMILEEHADRFCTVALGRLLLGEEGAEVALACAAHPAPLVLRRDGRVEAVEAGGPLIGVFPDARYSECALRVEPGDLLCLFTDGLTERRRQGEPFGTERIRALLESCAGLGLAELADAVETAADEWDPQVRDDSILLLLRLSAL